MFQATRTSSPDTALPPRGAALTVEQMAEALQCSHKTIRRMIAAGDLPAIKRGRLLRIPRHAAEAMIAGK